MRLGRDPFERERLKAGGRGEKEDPCPFWKNVMIPSKMPSNVSEENLKPGVISLSRRVKAHFAIFIIHEML